jgi:carboxymethylenebutenolidase
LVVTQEIFGVNRHIRKLCDDFAAAGYAVIAPQLFDRVERNVELGYDAADLARGRELRGKIDAGKTVLDVLAAAAALLALPEPCRAQWPPPPGSSWQAGRSPSRTPRR